MRSPSHSMAGTSSASSVSIRFHSHLSDPPCHSGSRDRFRFRPLPRRSPPPACGGRGGRAADDSGAPYGTPLAGPASSGHRTTAWPAHRGCGKAQQRSDEPVTTDSRDDAATGRLGGLGGRLTHPRAAGLGDARRGRERHGGRSATLGGAPTQRRPRRLVRRRPVAQRRLQPGRAGRRADALARRCGPAHPTGARCQRRLRRTRWRAWREAWQRTEAGQRPRQRTTGRHDAGWCGTSAGGASIWTAARSDGGETAARSGGATAAAGAATCLGPSSSRHRPDAYHDREGWITSISGGGL